jgi:hypothetical protein
LRQAIGFARHLIKTAAGVLLLCAAEQVGGFAEAIGGAACFGITLLAGRSLAHVVVRLLQAIEGLLDARIPRTLLARLSTLPGLSRLTGLT